MSQDKPELPWFRIQRSDGTMVEIHAMNAIEIYERDFKAKTLPESGKTDSSHKHTDAEGLHQGGGNLSSTISKPTGTTDAVLKMVATPWGKAKMRSQEEIRKSIEVAGYQFSKGAISGALTYLVQQGKLRRIKEGTQYVYGPPLGEG